MMIAKMLNRRWASWTGLLMLISGAVLSGCSPRTQTVIITPPEALLTPCVEAETSPAMLDALRSGDSRRAASEYVAYILRVRESHELCNGKIAGIRNFYDGLDEALNDD